MCPDSKACLENSVIEAEYRDTYGIDASGNSLELGFLTQLAHAGSVDTRQYSKNVTGSLTFLMQDDSESYELFKLKNQEYTFDVDVSKLPLGGC